MYLDEVGHIKVHALGHNSSEQHINSFKETHLDHLDEFQKGTLKEIIAYKEVMKHVTFKITPSNIGPVSLFSNDPEEIKKRELLLKESEEREKKQKEMMKTINRAIGYEMGKIQL
jgi:hypothetical protein